MTLAELEQQFIAAQNALQPYSDPNIGTNIQNQIQSAWSPLAQRTSGELQNQMATFLPRFMGLPYSGLGGGTSAADLNPFQKMQMMGSELGNMGGQLASTQGLLNAIGGNRQQMVSNAMDSLRTGYDMAGGVYDRAYQAYQNELAMEEQRRQAAQAAANQAAQQRALEALMAGLGETYNTVPDGMVGDELVGEVPDPPKVSGWGGPKTYSDVANKNPGKNLLTIPQLRLQKQLGKIDDRDILNTIYRFNPKGGKFYQQKMNLFDSMKKRFKNLFK